MNKRTVEGYLRKIAYIFADVGDDDSHLYSLGKFEFRLSRKMHAYAQPDPPLGRVCPVPIALLN